MSCISGWTGFWVLIVLVFLERQPAWAMDHSPLLKPEIMNHLMVTMSSSFCILEDQLKACVVWRPIDSSSGWARTGFMELVMMSIAYG